MNRIHFQNGVLRLLCGAKPGCFETLNQSLSHEQASERTSEKLRTYLSILGCSAPLWSERKFNLFHFRNYGAREKNARFWVHLKHHRTWHGFFGGFR